MPYWTCLNHLSDEFWVPESQIKDTHSASSVCRRVSMARRCKIASPKTANG